MASKSRKPTVLHLFSGPTDRIDGLRAIMLRVGWACHDVDMCNVITGSDKAPHDLACDSLWDEISLNLTIVWWVWFSLVHRAKPFLQQGRDPQGRLLCDPLVSHMVSPSTSSPPNNPNKHDWAPTLPFSQQSVVPAPMPITSVLY